MELRNAMRAALDESGKLPWAEQEFAYTLSKPAPVPRADRWRRTSNIHTLRTQRQLAIVRELWIAREGIAARRDVAPGRVLPDSAIVTAAVAAPETEDALTRLPVFGGPRQRRQATTWLRAVTVARHLPDAELPPRKQAATGPPPINRWEQRNPEAARRAHEVRPTVTEIAKRHAVPTENLLAPDVVRTLCWEGLPDTGPDVVEQWLADHQSRPWQRELTAEPIAAALRRASDPPKSS